MPQDAPGNPRSPSRFLHNRALRDDVLRQIKDNWPSGRSSWEEVQSSFARRLGLPIDLTSKAPGEHRVAPAIPPEHFREELLDMPGVRLEALVIPWARPVLLVQDNDFTIAPLDYWRQRLDAARAKLRQCIPEVGRIEVKDGESFESNGTAWRVRPTVVVTNAHVARACATRSGDKWVFRANPAGTPVCPRIDFRQEYERPEQMEFPITDILHIEEDSGPDMAFLRVEAGPERSSGIDLAPEIEPLREVAAIGYPKHDPSVRDPDLLTSIFGGIYDVKRLSPGIITGANPRLLKHDCSTLRGNSGSAVVDLATGRAAGLHFGGTYRTSNYAVPAPIIASRLADLGL